MKLLYRSVTVLLIHIAIVLSLGGKLLYDRATRPRVWVKTVSVDPDLPIRGRYLTLRLQVRAPWLNKSPKTYEHHFVRLTEENGDLVAARSDSDTGVSVSTWLNRIQPQPASDYAALDQTIAFFLPEHAPMPSVRPGNGEELWAEVTLPRKGPPRPIQLAIKDKSGWHPLNVR
ncbi:MAG TPA: hypothetical protein VN176_02445 [Verrucomicrobiae bacterium]|jgi:hypothetical protein|nr:hypothetical protein [Verrucomicrobiae bacterium]